MIEMWPLYREGIRSAGERAFVVWEHPENEPPPYVASAVREDSIVLVLPLETYAAIKELAASEREAGLASSAPSILKRWLADFESNKNCRYNSAADEAVRADFRELALKQRVNQSLRRGVTITVQAEISADLFALIDSSARRDAAGDHVAYLQGAILQKTMGRLMGYDYSESVASQPHSVRTTAAA